ncbi:MAG: protein-export chaperone SecB [Deltaproteobacteria bacterium]|nr:protein-export chaperone SecB [Deltaproteobacteria bacterium]
MATKKKDKNVRVEYNNIKEVSSVVSLRDVFLVSSHWESFLSLHSTGFESNNKFFNFKLLDATWNFDVSSKTLDIQLTYQLIAEEKSEIKRQKSNVRLFEMQFGWLVVFSVPETFKPTKPKVMADFTVVNGQLNAFPYVRQFVHEMTTRAGWPPLVLPTFLLPAHREAHLGSRRKATRRSK